MKSSFSCRFSRGLHVHLSLLTPSKTVLKKLSSYLRQSYFNRWFLKTILETTISRRFCKTVFTDCVQRWFCTWTVVVYFFFHASYGKGIMSISLSLSLHRLERCWRYGGALVAPPLEAPRKGSALEATIEGGGGLVVAAVAFCPQVCCLAALSQQWSLHR